MKSPQITKAVILVSALSMAASPLAVSTAFAQDQGPYQGGPYDQGRPYDQGGPPPDQGGPPPDQGPDQYRNDQGGPPPDQGADQYQNGDQYGENDQPPQPPAGYNGSQPPPPPPGYRPPADYDQQQREDARYAAYSERWAAENCVRSHGNVAAGAVIGGIFGALIGSAAGGPYHAGSGAAVGAAIGGTSGAAIAAGSGGNATSPGCPPGYVVRDGAPAFYYNAYAGPYFYAAPDWYRPWYWYGGHWLYRPYPYRAWYYRHYGGGRYGGYPGHYH
jgi:hypothetical protein